MEQNLALEDAVSIEGTLLMLDDTTPHVAVPVQVIQNGKVMATTLSDERGSYQFINLERGRYQVRCQVLGGYVYYGGGGSTIVNESKAAFLQVKQGITRDNIDFRFAPFKKGTWKNLTYLDGLADNSVFAIHRDPDGTLWFGTFGGGISVYDGKRFVTFTTEDGLVHNRVTVIQRDTDGALWFGTHGGVSRYDGRGMGDFPHFVSFTTEDGLVSNCVHTIHRAPDGVLWFGTDGGVSRYDGKTFLTFTTADGLAHNDVRVIYCEPDGNLWFGTFGGGVSVYDGKRFVTFTTEDGLAHNRVTAIQCDAHGALWFGTEGGLSRYNEEGFANFTTEDGLVHNNVRSIHCVSDGTLWLGTFGGGVSRYDGKGFVNFTGADGLVSNHVHAIHCDADGVLWFGTFIGVSRYDEQEFITFTTKDGLPSDDVVAIHQTPDGMLWLGSYGGISRYDGKEFVNFTTQDGLAHNWVCAIHQTPDGMLWFGTEGGISRYDGKAFVTFTTKDGLAHNAISVNAIHGTTDGMMWFGTDGGGVSRYDGKTFVTLSAKDGLADWVRAIYGDSDGIVWFGADGISRYDGKKFVTLTTEDGLVHNDVRSIHRAPDGVLWFGTNGGVSAYDGKGFVTFTPNNGLAHHKVVAIYAAPDGVICFGTEGAGVAVYDGTAWTSLDTRDGLAGDFVHFIYPNVDGGLWFGTDGGLTHYRRCSTPPLVHIVSVTTDQTYRDLSTVPSFTVGTRVTVEYNAIDLKTLPEKRQYRVAIVEGVADSASLQRDAADWLLPTRSTTFDHIFDKPGAYTFAVQAIDRDLNYSESAVLNLTVQPDPVLVSMQAELNHLRREVGSKYRFGSIIGRSPGIRQVRVLMERAIDSGLTVLITGETGTGKELVAKAIHHNSPCKERPLLARNCGAIPKELLASDLFGHRKGAFTGATEDKIGLFEAASGGTLLLDEISEMPEDAQVHLLRVLEERKVQRLGENISRDVDARVIAMANRDLVKEVSAGQFREDLYYRLSEFPIHIPPLRERPEDIPLLAEHFLQDIDRELGGFAPGVFEMLQGYSWPGNVRELRNVVRRAAAFVEEGEQIQTYHFPSQITQGESLIQEILSEQTELSAAVENLQKRMIEDALQKCGRNQTQAARILGVHQPNLSRLMKRLGID